MIVGLDIGTASIRVAIGDYNENKEFQILGTSCVKSSGMRNGNIVNIEAAAISIHTAIEAAQRNAGVEITSCYVSIGGEQIRGVEGKGNVQISYKANHNQEIEKEDIARVIEAASAIQITLDRERLHTITQDYIVDGVGGIKDPMHRLGVKLEASVFMVTASKTTTQNLKSCIKRAGYEMDGVMLKTLAAQKAVTTAEERELGSIIIDIGEGSTDAIILYHDAPVFVTSLAIGGGMITQDIAIVKGIPINEAERIKTQYGCCWQANVDNFTPIIINSVAGKPPEQMAASTLCEIITPRVEEILKEILNRILKNTALTQLSGNIVLIGGGANMDGILELTQDVFGTSAVRLGYPKSLGGIEENYNTPQWSTAVGLTLACKDLVSSKEFAISKKKHNKKNKEKKENIITRALKTLF